MKIELSVKDRFLIIHELLPPLGSRQWMVNNIQIREIVQLSDEEAKKIFIQGNQILVADPEGIHDTNEYEFEQRLLEYMKELVEILDKNGGFTENNIYTFDKVTKALNN